MAPYRSYHWPLSVFIRNLEFVPQTPCALKFSLVLYYLAWLPIASQPLLNHPQRLFSRTRSKASPFPEWPTKINPSRLPTDTKYGLCHSSLFLLACFPILWQGLDNSAVSTKSQPLITEVSVSRLCKKKLLGSVWVSMTMVIGSYLTVPSKLWLKVKRGKTWF